MLLRRTIVLAIVKVNARYWDCLSVCLSVTCLSRIYLIT